LCSSASSTLGRRWVGFGMGLPEPAVLALLAAGVALVVAAARQATTARRTGHRPDGNALIGRGDARSPHQRPPVTESPVGVVHAARLARTRGAALWSAHGQLQEKQRRVFASVAGLVVGPGVDRPLILVGPVGGSPTRRLVLASEPADDLEPASARSMGVVHRLRHSAGEDGVHRVPRPISAAPLAANRWWPSPR
jgi:hypothetical protein